MVHLAVEVSNPASTLQPAPWRTRCPECGTFSAWGRICIDCFRKLIDKAVNICPGCRAPSRLGAVCDDCAKAMQQAMEAKAAKTPPPLTEIQVVLCFHSAAQLGMCDIQMLVGPDAADGGDVLTPEEFAWYMRRAGTHLRVYAKDFLTAMAADAAMENAS